MADLIQYYGTGRRKSAIARVFLRPGSGKFTVNGKQFDEYFVTEQQRVAAKLPLGIADINETFDVLTTIVDDPQKCRNLAQFCRPGRRRRNEDCAFIPPLTRARTLPAPQDAGAASDPP